MDDRVPTVTGEGNVRKAWKARDLLRVGPDKVESRVEIKVVSVVDGLNSVIRGYIGRRRM